MLDWVCVEDDIIYNVLSLVTPVSNDALVTELHFAALNPLMLTLLWKFIFQFKYTIKATICWHELKNWVHNQSTPKLTLEGWGLETRKNSKFALSQINDILGIKEPWDFTNLLEVGITEGLFDNDINQVLADSVVLIFKFTIKSHNALSWLLDHNSVLSTR